MEVRVIAIRHRDGTVGYIDAVEILDAGVIVSPFETPIFIPGVKIEGEDEDAELKAYVRRR